jgi:prephenate dehydrogenase
MAQLPFNTIAIIGPGLLGGSLGLALKQNGWEGRIIGVARKESTLETARARGCIDEAVTDIDDAVAEADLIVLATPVQSACRLLERMADAVNPSAVITDVGSTKQSIVDTATRVLPNGSRFVGSHPMAGAETSGPAAARADLYLGKPVIVTPTERTAADASAAVESLWQTLGMRVRRMTPAEHDWAVAAISHLPHIVSAMLMQTARQSGALNVASTGLADMTRLAGGDVDMWTEIISDNRQAILDEIENWQEATTAFRDLLAEDDADKLTAWLAAARDARRSWNIEALGDDD